MSKLLKDTVTKWNKWFWIILSLAILIRLVILTEIPHALYHNDSASYTNQTHSLLTDGRGILNRRPLGYPLILASVISVAGDYLAVVIVQMLTGLAVAVILYHLFWKVYPNRTAALWLFGTLSLTTLGIVAEMSVLAELFFMSFVSLAFWMAMRICQKPGILYFLPFGLFAGFASLIKVVAIYYLPVGLLLALFLRGPAWRLKHIVLSMAVFSLSTLAFPLGQSLYNHSVNQYFGTNLHGGMQLFAISAHLLNLDSEPHYSIKQKLKPYMRNDKLGNIHYQINWLLFVKDGPRDMMMREAGSMIVYDKLCRDLAFDAIGSDPLTFLYRGAKVFVLHIFAANSTYNHFHKDYDTIHRKSHKYMNYHDDRFPVLYDIRKHNSTLHKPLDSPQKESFVKPYSSAGSAVRFLLTLSPLRINTIWTLSFILSFYLLFIRLRLLPKRYIPIYLIVLFHVGAHSLISVPNARYLYPVLPVMMFFSIMATFRWREARNEKSNKNFA